MPIYEYICKEKVEGKEEPGHTFELIKPMSEHDKPQLCPVHNCECQRVEFSNSTWMWGVNEIHWSAGIGSNLHGMNHAKKV